MNFNSWQFLLFLPVVVVAYWLLPHKARWIWLLAASYVFYMSWNVWLIGLILITTLTAYGSAIAIERAQRKGIKKLWLAAALIVCLGLLVFFKYVNFLLESAVGLVRLFGGSPDEIVLDIILPVGISFYTFQTLSYVIDVYRGNFAAERHLGYFALYVAYFPQLVAGPIERPQTLLPQLHEEHTLCEEDLLAGAKYLLSGFFRKCVVADFCGIFVDRVYADLGSGNALAVLVASALFLIQIYNDFAGYSEIAMGSARLMGVRLSKNFDRPLTSASYTEFFRRWHITLSRWFVDYVYIPLGGNRKGKARKILNTFIVFLLCGLWHGANWTFLLWGGVAGVMIGLETLLKTPAEKLCKKLRLDPETPAVKLVRQVFVFAAFTLSCVLFRAQSIAEVGIAFRQIFTAWSMGGMVGSALTSLGMSVENILQLVVFLVAMALIYYLPLESKKPQLQLRQGLGAERASSQNMAVFVYGVITVALCWLALLSMGDVSAFRYFQF